jgi:hypothetical protein
MNAIYAPRSLLGLVVGIAIGIPVTFVAENDMLAVVLGSLAAAAIAGLREIKTAVIVSSFTGAGLGLFLVARGERFFAARWAPAGPLGILVHPILGAIASGLVGALYSFMTAKLKPFFDEGRGPHF